MCITDCNYRFVTINVDAYGRQSEGGVLKQSAMGASLESGQLNLPGPRPLPGTRTLGMPVFLGDEAFQLRPDFLRPYPGKFNSDDKIIFNNRLSRVGSVHLSIVTQCLAIFRRVPR